MSGFSLSYGHSWPFGRRHLQGHRHSTNASASSSQPASSSTAGGSRFRVSDIGCKLCQAGLLRAAVTCGALSATGDVLAQTLSNRIRKSQGQPAKEFDLVRMLRMGAFGLTFYGPYQYYWYQLLDRSFPTRSAGHFLSKVLLNQIALAPVVLVVVFAWNLALTGQSHAIPQKIRKDLVPTMINGWKFWVPAASVNFWLIPLQQQVLYMSTCGVLWSGYLSFSSNS